MNYVCCAGDNEETLPFYKIYEQDLHDEPVNFDEAPHHDIRMRDVGEEEVEGDNDDRFISPEEIARQVRQLAERDEVCIINSSSLNIY